MLKKSDGENEHIGWLMGYIRENFSYVFITMLLILVSSCAFLWIGVWVKDVVDSGFLYSRMDESFYGILFKVLGYILVLSLLLFLRMLLVNYTGERVVFSIRRDVFNSLIYQTHSFFDRRSVGELVSTISTDTSVIQSVVGSGISVAMRNFVTAIGSFAMLIFVSPKLSFWAVSVVPFLFIVVHTVARKVKRLSVLSLDKVGDMSSYLNEVLSNIRIVNSFVREEREKQKFRSVIQEAFSVNIRYTYSKAILVSCVMLLITGSVVAILFAGKIFISSGQMTVGELSAFLFYLIMFANAIQNLSEFYGDLYKATGAVSRLFDIYNEEIEIKDYGKENLGSDVNGEIEINNIVFSYPSNLNNKVFDGMSMKINSGETVALVGHSGVGKSTLFHLLMRFYEVSSGVISIDGQDIRNLRIAEMRDVFGIVPQNPVMFSTTVRENILYGVDDVREEEMHSAAKCANAYDFIKDLPQGFDTFVGERGVCLSGGQKQRIAIARVMIKNPSILLLDEATSSLDIENERAVQEALTSLMKGRTTLIIAHRLSTVIDADKIIVFGKDGIQEYGTHKELLDKKGKYYTLFNLQ